MKWKFMLFVFFVGISLQSRAQSVINTKSGIKLSIVNKDYPLLKILLPGQPDTERGIEVEFPEHVTGAGAQTQTAGHLYLVSRGTANKRTMPDWEIKGNTIQYKTILNGNVTMVATATLDDNGVEYSYKITNNSAVTYQSLQAVTCVKLYSVFADTLLQRTYVHHPNGFELLASETPQRLTMPLQQWLPCRYLVSYTWPVPKQRIEKDEDGITRYYKSRKADKPIIATLSHDKQWVAATYTAETGNIWTNPERTCHHVDPTIDLKPGETKSLKLKTLLYRGNLEQALTQAL
jgi:hypothetical protein